MNNQNDHDTYIIPPNFVDTGTFFGGMFRARNVIEAGILAVATGLPVFLFLPFGLTARIIVLCLTTLPLVLFALIGISGESLSSFLVIFLKYMKNRRIVGGGESQEAVRAAPGTKKKRKEAEKAKPCPDKTMMSEHMNQSEKTEGSKKNGRNEKIGGISGWRRRGEEDFPAEFDQIKGYEIRQKLRPSQTQKKQQDGTQRKKSAGGRKRGPQQDSRKKAAGRSAGPDHRNSRQKKGRSPRKPLRTPEPQFTHLNPVADYLPIRKIENGIIYTKDHRYVKVVEVIPINFLLRSAREQRGIIYSFVSYLKISPVKLQFKVLTRRADIGRHMDTVRREMAQETNEQCRLMQEDYLQFIQQICSREAVTRRFFLVFEYEPWNGARRTDEEGEAIGSLQSAVHTASNYLRQCGNEVVLPDNEDEFTIDVLYNLLCRNESAAKPLPVRAKEVVAQYLADGRESDIDHIPAGEFIAPRSIDFTHGRYICIDGLYYAYLLIPSDGYKTHVPAGWLSLMVNAGDGIDLDMFLSRQPKERIIQKVGQQLRINRSRIKDASDTNTDFDDIDSAIRSGYFLKEGLANNEDFYFMNLLVTVTAPNEEDLEWKVSEMKKLLLSQDMRPPATSGKNRHS